MAYSDKVIDHYSNPRNVGSFSKDDPDVGTGIVGAPECGDVMKLQLKISDDGIAQDARFKTFGCGSAIGITDQAARKIQTLVAQKGLPDAGLRVKVVGGGCSGLTYKMDVDRPREGDKVFEHDGAKLVVDRKSFLYLRGTELDYKEELMASGFNLRNPNVKRTCGCGASFVV